MTEGAELCSERGPDPLWRLPTTVLSGLPSTVVTGLPSTAVSGGGGAMEEGSGVLK